MTNTDYNRRYYQEHRDYYKLKNAQYRRKNKVKLKAMRKKWYAEHKDEIREQVKLFHQRHPEKNAEYKRNYRAKLKAIETDIKTLAPEQVLRMVGWYEKK